MASVLPSIAQSMSTRHLIMKNIKHVFKEGSIKVFEASVELKEVLATLN